MSIICAIIVAWVSRCLVTRIALGDYRGRLTGFFRDRANILVYGWPYCINVYTLAPDNEFPEISYAFYGGRQNIFSTIFGTKFVVDLISGAKILKSVNK